MHHGASVNLRMNIVPKALAQGLGTRKATPRTAMLPDLNWTQLGVRDVCEARCRRVEHLPRRAVEHVLRNSGIHEHTKIHVYWITAQLPLHTQPHVVQFVMCTR